MTETSVITDPSITPSEERRRTGRYVAVGLVVIACLLGLHHAFVKQNAVLAGLIVPALIMVFYILWVLHSAKKANHKHTNFEVKEIPTVVIKEATPSPTESSSNIPIPPSTSADNLNKTTDVP
ncbi:uncharacterized protein [Periplaneta americana]|uniref:uncharacterized protein n=1 Tax=Periplaneta americana TaxID=6978 RepID=UPI0037E9477D